MVTVAKATRGAGSKRDLTAYLIVPRYPVEHVHDEPLRTEPGKEASEQRS
jgi:hypothetical protein